MYARQPSLAGDGGYWVWPEDSTESVKLEEIARKQRSGGTACTRSFLPLFLLCSRCRTSTTYSPRLIQSTHTWATYSTHPLAAGLRSTRFPPVSPSLQLSSSFARFFGESPLLNLSNAVRRF